MNDQNLIAGTDETWESRELGASETHVKRAPPELESGIEEALGMQMISIRLNKSLIESFKVIAEYHGIGYQPLMRDALKRFAESEMKAIVQGVVESQRKSKQADRQRPLIKEIKAA
ncbi:MAG: hypothetical protein KGZ83_17165 [Sulfuricella sp.]|nr:hypothetical protein [Sulfuricella sp.]